MNVSNNNFIKPKEQIYNEIITHFNNYNRLYITKLLDNLYYTKFLTDDISIPGWSIFVSKYVIQIIEKNIIDATLKSYKRLYFFKILNNKCEIDIIRLIIEKDINKIY